MTAFSSMLGVSKDRIACSNPSAIYVSERRTNERVAIIHAAHFLIHLHRHLAPLQSRLRRADQMQLLRRSPKDQSRRERGEGSGSFGEGKKSSETSTFCIQLVASDKPAPGSGGPKY